MNPPLALARLVGQAGLFRAGIRRNINQLRGGRHADDLPPITKSSARFSAALMRLVVVSGVSGHADASVRPESVRNKAVATVQPNRLLIAGASGNEFAERCSCWFQWRRKLAQHAFFKVFRLEPTGR